MPRKKSEPKTTKQSKSENIQCEIDESSTPQPEVKKRGRKPKGGKLIEKNAKENNVTNVPTNVILHLKCSLKDIEEQNEHNITDPLNYSASIPPTIKAYDHINDGQFFELKTTEDNQPNAYTDIHNGHICTKCKQGELQNTLSIDNDVNIKDINQKLKHFNVSIYNNNIDEKKSACFWCTCDFDNQTCYIPRYENNHEIFGYGSFCRPECAVAYLMKENIDDSTKFERYHLLNSVYSKIYEFKNNIKPAPDPHFLLDKFYGNLNIQEYRKLLNSERMLMVIDSPLTRILPELHEDTDDFTAGIYGGNKGTSSQAGGVYKVKRQSEKKETVSKAAIMKQRFGVSA